MPDQVIALLEARIRHLAREAERNKRSNYAELSRWRRLEVEFLLKAVRKLLEETKP